MRKIVLSLAFVAAAFMVSCDFGKKKDETTVETEVVDTNQIAGDSSTVENAKPEEANQDTAKTEAGKAEETTKPTEKVEEVKK